MKSMVYGAMVAELAPSLRQHGHFWLCFMVKARVFSVQIHLTFLFGQNRRNENTYNFVWSTVNVR